MIALTSARLLLYGAQPRPSAEGKQAPGSLSESLTLYAALSPGSRPTRNLLLDRAGTRFLHSGPRTRNTRTARKSPGLEKPRPLGTGRRVRACEAPGLVHRARLCLSALPSTHSRSRFPHPPPLEGRATCVVCDCWFHVGGTPVRSLCSGRSTWGESWRGRGADSAHRLPPALKDGISGTYESLWRSSRPRGKRPHGKKLGNGQRNFARRAPFPELRRPEPRLR